MVSLFAHTICLSVFLFASSLCSAFCPFPFRCRLVISPSLSLSLFRSFPPQHLPLVQFVLFTLAFFYSPWGSFSLSFCFSLSAFLSVLRCVLLVWQIMVCLFCQSYNSYNKVTKSLLYIQGIIKGNENSSKCVKMNKCKNIHNINLTNNNN